MCSATNLPSTLDIRYIVRLRTNIHVVRSIQIVSALRLDYEFAAGKNDFPISGKYRLHEEGFYYYGSRKKK